MVTKSLYKLLAGLCLLGMLVSLAPGRITAAQDTPPTAETLWQEIEAAYNAGDIDQIEALIRQIPQSDWMRAARLLEEIRPPEKLPAPPLNGPVPYEEEARQAAEEDTRRAALAEQEQISREHNRNTTLEAEQLNTPAGPGEANRPQAILTVGDSCTYANLQAAIDAATSGDIIRVQAKTFSGSNGSVNIDDKSLYIYGGYDATCTTQGSSKTVMDATGQADSVFEIYGATTARTVVIDNFEITGGESDANQGGGVEVDANYTVTLQRSFIHSNDSAYGGGIHVIDGVVELEATWVYLNNALATGGDGGGIYCQNGTVRVQQASYIGFWLFAYFPNTATGNGGGIYADACNVYLNGNASGEYASVAYNNAAYGGGVYATNLSYVQLMGNNARIASNTASSNGGGAYLAAGADLYVDSGVVSYNTAGDYGGGVYATGAGSIADFDSTASYYCPGPKCAQLSNNAATSLYGGGAFVAADASIDLEAVYVEDNTSGSLGSAIYARGDGSVGIDSAMVTGNSSGSDYALRLFNSGGSPNATVRGSTFAGNSGSNVAVFGIDDHTRLNGDALIVWGNTGPAGSSIVEGSGDVTIDCSIVQYAFPGSNNAVSDPDFWDAANDDYHIARTSPAVDRCNTGFGLDVDQEARPNDVSGVGTLMAAAQQVTQPQRQSASHAVRLYSDELGERSLAEALPSGALAVRDYGSWIWLELDDAQFAELKGSGLPFEEDLNFGMIQFDGIRFDPVRQGEPEIPAGLRGAPVNESAYGLFFVQLFAPANSQDMDTLASGGVSLQYYPHNTYLVWANPKGVERLQQAENVRWVGAFHSAYRLTARLVQSPAPDGLTTWYQALFLDDGNLAQVEQAILNAGGQILTQAPRHVMGENARMTVWEFTLPYAYIYDLANLPQTIVVDRQGESRTDDERSNQIIADNAPSGEPALGYQAWLTEIGLSGDGIKVAIVDSGVDWDHPDLNVVSGIEYGGYTETGEPGSDGGGGDAGHGTHVAGIVAADGGSATADPDGFVYGLGIAPDATLHAMDAIGGGPSVSLYTRVFDAASNADLSNNSWNVGGPAGYTLNAANQDDYVLDAIDTNGNVRDPFLTVFSSGNAGDDCGSGPCMSSITEPKEAKNIVTVGNGLSRRSNTSGGLTGNINSLAGSSSRGPAFDGRLLPNVIAPGSNIISTENRVVEAGGTINFVCATSPANSTQHAYCGGTSMSSPHVTGAAALFTEFWRVRNNTTGEPEPATTKAAIILSADNLAGGDNGWGSTLGNRPDNHQGWGRVNMDRMLNPAVPVQYYQNPDLLQNSGEYWEIQVYAYTTGEPLRVTLVWSDAPGAAGANPALVNNLNLSVTSSGGTVYRGNVFSGGWSTSGGSYDTLNNVENVWLQTPGTGLYTIRVTGTTINGDAYYYNGDASDQHFSLVCHNCEQIVSGTYDAGADEAYAFVGVGGASCAYPTISAAIAAAPAGGTVFISPGTYPERLGIINKNLTLQAADNDCTTQATGSVTIDANDAAATYGGVVEIANSAAVTLVNLSLTDGSASYGGILYAGSGSSVVLDNTNLSFGSATDIAGGLRAYNNAQITLRNGSEIYENDVTGTSFGGGGVAGYLSTIRLYDESRIGDFNDPNQSAGRGGGVELQGGLLQLFGDSRIRSNIAATLGGGIYAFQGADIELYDSADIGYIYTTAANSAVDGGGAYLSGSGTSLRLYGDSAVQYNDASGNGAGVYVTGGATILSDGGKFLNNETTGGMGGGIYADGVTLDIKNILFEGNSAALHGGGIAAVNAASLTLGATCNAFSLPANTYCTELRANTAGSAGAGYGGGIYLDGNSSATIRRTAFIGNLGDWGGALEVYAGSATVQNSLFTGNDGGVNDSAVHVYWGASLVATNNTFANNPATPVFYVVIGTPATGQFNNNIVWGNDANISLGNATASCNDTQGSALPGAGNISQDPGFVTTFRGNYRLNPVGPSPAINQCATGASPDLDGIFRPEGGTYDMGAFEYSLLKVYLPLIRK